MARKWLCEHIAQVVKGEVGLFFAFQMRLREERASFQGSPAERGRARDRRACMSHALLTNHPTLSDPILIRHLPANTCASQRFHTYPCTLLVTHIPKVSLRSWLRDLLSLLACYLESSTWYIFPSSTPSTLLPPQPPPQRLHPTSSHSPNPPTPSPRKSTAPVPPPTPSMPHTHPMSCQVCRNPLNPTTPFHCPTCARTLLFPLRLSQATTLLERESFGKHVESVVTGEALTAPDSRNLSLSGALVNLEESAKHAERQKLESEAEEVRERLGLIDDQVKLLQKQIETGRTEIEERKKALQRRRADLKEAKRGAEAQRAKELERVKNDITKMGVLGDRLHNKTVYARRQLCAEAAALVGLRQTPRKGRDGKKKYGYYIGNLRIYDLQELHGECSSLSSTTHR